MCTHWSLSGLSIRNLASLSFLSGRHLMLPRQHCDFQYFSLFPCPFLCEAPLLRTPHFSRQFSEPWLGAAPSASRCSHSLSLLLTSHLCRLGCLDKVAGHCEVPLSSRCGVPSSELLTCREVCISGLANVECPLAEGGCLSPTSTTFSQAPEVPGDVTLFFLNS